MMGQAMELREDWEEVKLKVMLEDALYDANTWICDYICHYYHYYVYSHSYIMRSIYKCT